MKLDSSSKRRGAAAAAAGALMLMAAVVMTGTSRAQDMGGRGSAWESVDRVLVLPPVYKPDAAANAQSDVCAEDCPNQGSNETPLAVHGTADNPTDESVAVNGITPDDAGSQEQQMAAGGARQSADSLDETVGSAQDYRAQQAPAQGFGPYGMIQVPVVIVGAPVGPYYRPRTVAPSASVSAPVWPFPGAPASWMPQPMSRIAPLPPIIPEGASPTVGGFANMSALRGGIPSR